jgi:prepilin-type N-terminal cleavage/methylation domain-containing protein
MSEQQGSSWPTTRRTLQISRDDGYTLVELLLVMLLLGVLATAAVASFSGVVANLRLDAAATEIKGALLYARNLSAASNVTNVTAYGVWFTPPQGGADNGNWFQCIQAGPLFPLDVTHPVNKRTYKIDFDTSGYFQGITLISVGLDPQNRVFFDKRGTPSVSGSVIIQYGGQTRTITVSGPFGTVSIS